MNTELFIAKRLVFDKESKKHISRSIVRIAVFGIALGLAVMIITIAIVTAFKEEIRNKVVGFGSHIQIANYDANISFETSPINKNQDFYPDLLNINGIKHVQVYGLKAGIIKTERDIQGAVLKGIGSDFDWSFFQKHLIDGELFTVTDTSTSNQILISNYVATLLELNSGDDIIMYFVQDPPRMRRFTISGIYDTSLEEFDKLYLIADIGHIRRLNNWEEDQISGFEITVNNFKDLEYLTYRVNDVAGFRFLNDGSSLRVTNIEEKHPQIFDWMRLFDMNVIIIITLMLLVAGINMVSGLLILILERTNMIGVLKALGTENINIRKIFLYISGFLIIKGLIWGNVIGLGFCYFQYKTGLLSLDPSAYFLTEVPVNFEFLYFFILNLGTLVTILLILIIPSFIISKLSPVKTIRFN